MSMRRVAAAILRDYGSPLYPKDEIQKFVKAFTRVGPAGFSAPSLNTHAMRCASFVTGSRLLRTTDRYVWRCILEFRAGNGGQVAIAIPCTQDWERADGVQLDRSPAVYVTGTATPDDAKEVIQALTRVLSG
jgi:hypothetical protein